MAGPAMITDPSVGDKNDGFGTKGYRSYVLSALLIVYIFNFIDRTIINILTEPIKESFGVEDWQMGLLGGPTFAILYTLLGLPIARFAERFNRVWIIVCAVAMWSLMTALCGFATTFVLLLIVRIGVGIGEAGCTPPAQSLIADYFKPSSRATAVSIYALGVPLGGMLASVLGGTISEQVTGPNFAAFLDSIGLLGLTGGINWNEVEGWRIAFVLVGLPGILVAVIVKLTVKEPPRGYTDPAHIRAKSAQRVSFGEALRILASKPTYWHVVVGATVASFVGYGVGQFTTSFFIRTHGLSLQFASLLFGIILGVMAAIGVFLSGYLSDKFAVRHPTALSWIPALGMGLSVPLYAIGYLSDNLFIAVPPLMAAALLHYFYLGPMYAVAGGVVDSRTRATSVAITLLVVNLIGYGLGPLVIGVLSTFLKSMFLDGAGLGLTIDACKVTEGMGADLVAACNSANAKGLQWSIIIFICGYGWAALHYLIAGKTLKQDMVSTSDE